MCDSPDLPLQAILSNGVAAVTQIVGRDVQRKADKLSELVLTTSIVPVLDF
jgi:hypothetical protein